VIIYANEFGSYRSSRLAAMLDVMTVPDSVSSPFSALSCALTGFERHVEVFVDGISKLFLELRQTKAALEQGFYRSLDSSVIRSGLSQSPRFRHWELFGEGRHFQCFKLPGRGGMDLAILLAKPAFLKDDQPTRLLWIQNLKRLSALQHPLIPPMEVIEDTEFFAYVQPFCEAELIIDNGIVSLLQDLEKAMDKADLFLADYPQLRRCQGHPFLIDFSELKSRTQPGTRKGFRF
jgi:hypothetical protein